MRDCEIGRLLLQSLQSLGDLGGEFSAGYVLQTHVLAITKEYYG